MNKPIENSVVAYLLHRKTVPEIKVELPVLRNIEFSEKNRAIITLAEKYVDSPTEDPFSEYVLYNYPDTDHYSELFTSFVGKKTYQDNVAKLINQQEETIVKKTIGNLGSKPISEVLSELKTLKPLSPKKPKTLEEIRDSRLYDRSIEKDAPSTGYSDLDVLIKGFLPGHIYTMTGETNVGKTQIACNFAFRVALQGKRVLYFALEPDNTIIEYLASVWSRKPFNQLTKEDLNPKVLIDVYTKDQVKNLEEMVQIVQDSERYDLIIIDHFGYFTTTETNNKTQQESNAMKIIAQLAKRQKCAFLSIVHPRKPSTKGKNKVISMNDISGSASFKQDSTEVLLIFRETREEDQFGLEYVDTGYILVAKTKSGRSGSVQIQFVPDSAVILDAHDVSGTF